MSKVVASISIAVALIIGLVVGFASAGQQPGPEVITKTKTVKVPGPTQTKTVTKYKIRTVTKEVTPQACIDAMRDSAEVIKTQGDALTVAGDALKAVNNLDLGRLQADNTKMGHLSDLQSQQLDSWTATTKQCSESR